MYFIEGPPPAILLHKATTQTSPFSVTPSSMLPSTVTTIPPAVHSGQHHTTIVGLQYLNQERNRSFLLPIQSYHYPLMPQPLFSQFLIPCCLLLWSSLFMVFNLLPCCLLMWSNLLPCCLLMGSIPPSCCLLMASIPLPFCLLMDSIPPSCCLLMGSIPPPCCLLMGSISPPYCLLMQSILLPCCMLMGSNLL